MILLFNNIIKNKKKDSILQSTCENNNVPPNTAHHSTQTDLFSDLLWKAPQYCY